MFHVFTYFAKNKNSVMVTNYQQENAPAGEERTTRQRHWESAITTVQVFSPNAGEKSDIPDLNAIEDDRQSVSTEFPQSGEHHSGGEAIAMQFPVGSMQGFFGQFIMAEAAPVSTNLLQSINVSSIFLNTMNI